MLQPLVIVALLASPPGPAAAASRPAELEAALRAGSEGTLMRLGRELAAAGLTPLLAPSAPRLVRLAAIEASVAAPDAPLLLGALARLAGRPDRRAAASAARAAAAIAGNFSRSRALELDLAGADIARWGEAWMNLAGERGRWTDVRVHALEVAAALSDALAGDADRRSFDLARALVDPEPQLRRAALELVPIPVPDDLLEAVRSRIDDADGAVALAAAQAVCAAVPLADDDGAQAALDRLGGGRARVLALLADDDVELLPGAAVDIARCLVAAPDADAGPVLRGLASRLPSAARPALDELLAERRRRGLP